MNSWELFQTGGTGSETSFLNSSFLKHWATFSPSNQYFFKPLFFAVDRLFPTQTHTTPFLNHLWIFPSKCEHGRLLMMCVCRASFEMLFFGALLTSSFIGSFEMTRIFLTCFVRVCSLPTTTRRTNPWFDSILLCLGLVSSWDSCWIAESLKVLPPFLSLLTGMVVILLGLTVFAT